MHPRRGAVGGWIGARLGGGSAGQRVELQIGEFSTLVALELLGLVPALGLRRLESICRRRAAGGMLPFSRVLLKSYTVDAAAQAGVVVGRRRAFGMDNDAGQGATREASVEGSGVEMGAEADEDEAMEERESHERFCEEMLALCAGPGGVGGDNGDLELVCQDGIVVRVCVCV